MAHCAGAIELEFGPRIPLVSVGMSISPVSDCRYQGEPPESLILLLMRPQGAR